MARFSFNSKTGLDEINNTHAKLVGVSFTKDRFGNEDHAVYLHGNGDSYINLGNYRQIKPKKGSVSMWVNVQIEVTAGQGHKINPFILTKCTTADDYYEAFGMYYTLEGKNVLCITTLDSIKQNSIISSTEFTRYTWHHLVMAYDNNTIQFYIDGKKEGEVNKGFETLFSPNDSVIVGVSANAKNNRFLNGAVDDIEFYNKMLSETEVLELYRAPNPNKSMVIFNWILGSVAVLILILFLYLIIKYQLKKGIVKEKEKIELQNKLLETELRVNRASMNPHFLFNSLNALHNLILSKEIDNASDYLVKFSKLIRKILDSNMHESISLDIELELLHLYLELENLRFEENIQYIIVTEDSFTASTVNIPIMMIQPFVENAVWHGLLNKTGDKTISVSFSRLDESYIYCVIEDNGTGRRTTGLNLTKKNSLATAFIRQRLDLLNKIHGLKCSLFIEDKPKNTGTIVKIMLPILNK